MTFARRSPSARHIRSLVGKEAQMTRETIVRKNAITILMTTIIVDVRIKVAKRNAYTARRSQRPARTTRNIQKENLKDHAKNAMRSQSVSIVVSQSVYTTNSQSVSVSRNQSVSMSRNHSVNMFRNQNVFTVKSLNTSISDNLNTFKRFKSQNVSIVRNQGVNT
jgi:hypothetical protein